MTGIFDPNEFVKAYTNGNLIPAHDSLYFDCMVKIEDVKASYILYSVGNSCDKWDDLPIEAIHKIEVLGVRNCNDRSYPAVRIYLLPPQVEYLRARCSFPKLQQLHALQSGSSRLGDTFYDQNLVSLMTRDGRRFLGARNGGISPPQATYCTPIQGPDETWRIHASFDYRSIGHNDEVFLTIRRDVYFHLYNGGWTLQVGQRAYPDVVNRSMGPGTDEKWLIRRESGLGAMRQGDEVYISPKNRPDIYLSAPSGGLASEVYFVVKPDGPASDEAWEIN